MAPSPSSRSAEPIPGYVLRDRIGAGGYGEVWSCEAPGGLIKAIKFIYGFHDEDRATRELKALNRVKGVRHPFLLSLERIEVVSGQLVIVTELAEASLKDIFDRYVKEGKPGIPRAELLGYMHDTADALDYMNEHHMLQHLDVKPENLLVLGGRIKVADFGLVKDLHESQCSLMGGLTPIYAPPEVFDAHPSRRSDQYSLAIVFQEMLTGLLPFPGKTAAQLAAQHLNARPLLSTLPTTDQPIIAKALSKDPQQRYVNCREMVEALMAAAAAPTRVSPAGPPPSLLAKPVTPAGQNTEVRGPSEMLESADAALQAAASDDCYAVQPHFGPEAFIESPPAPLVDAPPQIIDPQTVKSSPTLFIGVGGIGVKTCQQLKRQLMDALGNTQSSFSEFLAIDTDSREIQSSQIGEFGEPLSDEQVIAIPLRKPQDYREDSRELLAWLGRRWLYNIPRSQQTEGMRPLGRLAYVDHCQDVYGRIRTALESLNKRYRESLQNNPSATPRSAQVVIVASTSGGTAGGIALDIVFATRQLLDELAPRGAINLVLVHAANRSPAAKELASANTIATLTEIRQMLAPGSYFPGDPAACLSPRNNQVSPVNDLSLIPVGANLSADDLAGVATTLAEMLVERTFSAASGLLNESFTKVEESLSRSTGGSTTVRTLGMARIGFTHDPLLTELASRLTHQVIDLWTGEPSIAAEAPSMLASAVAVAPALNPHDGAIDLRTDDFVQSVGLTGDVLVQSAMDYASQQLAGNPLELFNHLRDSAGPYAAGQKPPLERWVSSTLTLFGPRPYDEVPPNRNSSPLRTCLFDAVKDLAQPLGKKLAQWLLLEGDIAPQRVYSALRSAKRIQSSIKDLIEGLRLKRKELEDSQRSCEAQLVALSQTEPAKWSRVKPPLPEPTVAFTRYCQIRLLDLCVEVANQVARAIQSHVTAANDMLLDLARDVKFLHTELGQPPAQDPSGEADAALQEIRLKVRSQVIPTLSEAAIQLDQQLKANQLAKPDSLRTILCQGGQPRIELLQAIRNLSRQVIVEKLAKVDLLGLALTTKTSQGETLFTRLLKDAQPSLAKVGGLRRTYVLLPEKASKALSASELSNALNKTPISLLPSRNNEVVFLVDVRVASLAKAAAWLIEGRADLADVARRLHTRADIDWQPL